MNKKFQCLALIAAFITAFYLSVAQYTPTTSPQTKTAPAASYLAQRPAEPPLRQSTAKKEPIQTVAHAQNTANHPEVQNLSDTNTENEVLAALIQTEGFSDYLTQLPNDAPYKLFQDMKINFSEEEIDYSWALPEEESFHSLFTDTSELNYFVPSSIQCRTTTCQISLHFSDPDEANKAIELFSAAVKNLKQMTIIATPDFSKGELNLYALKK